MYYRFGHNNKNFVKKGDKVKKGQKIAEIGTGNHQWSAHLHLDVSRKPITTEYIIGWTKKQVEEQYVDPHTVIENLNTVSINHHYGWNWLSWIGNGWHPGVDINGPGAGNADVGQPIYSPIDGVVTYSYNGTGKNGGWGKLLVIEVKNNDMINDTTSVDKPQEVAILERLEALEKRVKTLEEEKSILEGIIVEKNKVIEELDGKLMDKQASEYALQEANEKIDDLKKAIDLAKERKGIDSFTRSALLAEVLSRTIEKFYKFKNK